MGGCIKHSGAAAFHVLRRRSRDSLRAPPASPAAECVPTVPGRATMLCVTESRHVLLCMASDVAFCSRPLHSWPLSRAVWAGDRCPDPGPSWMCTARTFRTCLAPLGSPLRLWAVSSCVLSQPGAAQPPHTTTPPPFARLSASASTPEPVTHPRAHWTPEHCQGRGCRVFMGQSQHARQQSVSDV